MEACGGGRRLRRASCLPRLRGCLISVSTKSPGPSGVFRGSGGVVTDYPSEIPHGRGVHAVAQKETTRESGLLPFVGLRGKITRKFDKVNQTELLVAGGPPIAEQASIFSSARAAGPRTQIGW